MLSYNGVRPALSPKLAKSNARLMRPSVATKVAMDLEATRSSESLNTWKVTIRSTAPLLGDTANGLSYSVVDEKTGYVTEPVTMDGWTLSPTNANDWKQGWRLRGEVQLPEDLKNPGAFLLRKEANTTGGVTTPSVSYISDVDLNFGAGATKLTIPVHSWVSSEHGDRVFFGPKAYLPSATPAKLRSYRENELRQIRGDDNPNVSSERKGADRIYGYQVYDDLGTSVHYRPALGNSAMLPYPRRIATNRSKDVLGQEKPPVKSDENPSGGPWLPYDEQFSFNKSAGFDGNKLSAGISLAASTIRKYPKWQLVVGLAYQLLLKLPLIGGIFPRVEFPPVENFQDFRDVLLLFNKTVSGHGVSAAAMTQGLYPGNAAMGMSAATATGKQSKFRKADGSWDIQINDEDYKEYKDDSVRRAAGPAVIASAKQSDSTDADDAAAMRSLDQAPPKPSLGDILQYVGSDLAEQGSTLRDLFHYSLPRSLENRPTTWYTDEEMGRQALAGMHPCTITALKATPESLGSAIRNEHVQDDLQGASLEQLVSEAAAGNKPRLYWMDYWALSHFWPETPANASLVQHAGRALFYLKRKEKGGMLTDEDEALIPVAIELAHKSNAKGTQGVVYSRSELSAKPETLVVWRLAKAVFRSLDSSHHQLVSHWLRTHACLEPFLIAMRRQMSIMHPVFKLMLPHFRYTLNINANARSTLVNVGGIIENNFSAGEHAMRLSSVVYRNWRFIKQALPEDLKIRGMVDENGKPWFEYPYAEDGMDLWRAFEKYFSEFIKHHYVTDYAVENDHELQAWWHEMKTVGHGDIINHGLATEAECWGFTGLITTQAQLVHILVTIAWTASAHHAAVNFGQYDFSGLILNYASMVRKPMPAKGDKEYMELVTAPMGPPQEAKMMEYLPHVVAALSVMTTVKLLSAHAEGEQTLDLPNDYLKDDEDAALNRKFIEEMKRLERVFETRNGNPASWTRAATALNDKTMPYTLLLPSSKESGVTCRGVPYSVSI